MSEPLNDSPTEAQWVHAADVLDWLYKVTGDDQIPSVIDLLDRTMRGD